MQKTHPPCASSRLAARPPCATISLLTTVYLSLGSNLGDRAALLDRAIAALPAAGLLVQRVSSVYQTEPVGVHNQPWFLNSVVEAETDLFPAQLLARLQAVEIQLGRRRPLSPAPSISTPPLRRPPQLLLDLVLADPPQHRSLL